MRSPAHLVSRWLGLLCTAGSVAGASGAAAAQPPHHRDSAWQHAVQARVTFDAQPSHTRAGFTSVLNDFRAVYHDDPADAHAPSAVEQVAELLALQGQELADPKSLSDSRAQYAFLLRAYPHSSAAAEVRRRRLDSTLPPMQAREEARPDKRAPEEARADATSVTPVAAPVSHTGGAVATVEAVRHWSTSSYTRVVVDLGASDADVRYKAARVENPDRIFFDVYGAHLSPSLAGKSFSVTDGGFLTRIRAAQYSADVVRVVLDVRESADYSAFLLPNPTRLIIDIHGQTAPPALAANTPVQQHTPPHAEPVATGGSAEPASTLPPMPVTDASAGFGLPPRTSGETSTAAAPRVVIPTRATNAHPVPNSTMQHAAETPSEVAAVSAQPGVVNATAHPTSAPVASRGNRTRRGHMVTTDTEPAATHTAGEPVAAPPALAADGRSSLMRALGLKIGRIVIDAGHGGHDSGTLGADGIEEKDVVLDVALRLGKLLHDRLGAEIVYTRADDTFIPLETRTAIANKAQADLFISVHANSSQDPSARGVEVYYLNFTSDPDAMQLASRENAVSTQSVHELSDLVKKIALKDKIDESRELATDVDTSLYAGLAKGNAGLKNRGVKKAPFVVLIGANMPSILAEISFVTNPTDAAQLQTAAYRERVAESLYRGIAQYEAAINGAPHTPLQHTASAHSSR